MLFSLFLRTEQDVQTLPVEDFSTPEAVIEKARDSGLIYESSEIQYEDDCVFFFFADLELNVQYTLVCDGNDARNAYKGKIVQSWAALEWAEETFDEMFRAELMSSDELSEELGEDTPPFEVNDAMPYVPEDVHLYYQFDSPTKMTDALNLYVSKQLTWEKVLEDNIQLMVSGDVYVNGKKLDHQTLGQFRTILVSKQMKPDNYGDKIFSWVNEDTGENVDYETDEIFSEVIVNAFFNTLHNQIPTFDPGIVLPTTQWMKGCVLRVAYFTTGSTVPYSSYNAMSFYDLYRNISSGEWKFSSSSKAKDSDEQIISFYSKTVNATRNVWIKNGMLLKVFLALSYAFAKEEDRIKFLDQQAVRYNYAVATTLKEPSFYHSDALTEAQIQQVYRSGGSVIYSAMSAPAKPVTEEQKSSLRAALAAGTKPETEEDRVARADMALGKLLVLGDKNKKLVERLSAFETHYPLRHQTDWQLGVGKWGSTLPRWAFVFRKVGHVMEEWRHIETFCFLTWTSFNNFCDNKDKFSRMKPQYLSNYSAEAKALFAEKPAGSPQSNNGIEIHQTSDVCIISVPFMDDLPMWAQHIADPEVQPYVWNWDASELKMYKSTPELTHNIVKNIFKEYSIRGEGIAPSSTFSPRAVAVSKGKAVIRKEADTEVKALPGYIKSFLTYCSSKS